MITPARAKASFDFLVETKLIDPAKVNQNEAYNLSFLQDAKVLP